MSEFSLPWPAVSPQVGDGRAYTDAEWRAVWRGLFLGAKADVVGVLPMPPGALYDELEVSSPGANQLSVESGMACVDGLIYTNTAPIALAPTSAGAGATRIDRVILRAVWAAGSGQYQVVCQIKQGSDVAAPTLQQDANVAWEVSLAQYTIDDVGAITGLTDEREFVNPLVYRRQGASASDWCPGGGVTYRPGGNAILQCGSTGLQAIGAAGTHAITFPEPFGGVPLVFIEAAEVTAGNFDTTFVFAYQVSETGFEIANPGGQSITGYFQWLAIGPRA